LIAGVRWEFIAVGIAVMLFPLVLAWLIRWRRRMHKEPDMAVRAVADIDAFNVAARKAQVALARLNETAERQHEEREWSRLAVCPICNREVHDSWFERVSAGDTHATQVLRCFNDHTWSRRRSLEALNPKKAQRETDV